MKNYRILYIEHDRARDQYAFAMERGGAAVDKIDYVDRATLLQDVRSKLFKTRFDAVITDAFFLPQGVDHEDETKGEYLLDDLVSVVREFDDHRIRIVVMTYFSTEILRAKSVDKINDIWDKHTAPLDYVVWKVKRMQEDSSRYLPERALLRAISALQTQGAEKDAHYRSVMESVEHYQTRLSVREQMVAVKPDLMSIADKLGNEFPAYFHSLLDSIVKAEPINVGGAQSSWGHLSHALNVWWLGWYFLHCGWLDLDEVVRRMSPTHGDTESLLKRQILEQAWFLAALFHDIGRVYEVLPTLVSEVNVILRFFPIGCILETPNATPDKEDVMTFITKMSSAAGSQSLANAFSAMGKSPDDTISDHGFLSAYGLFKQLSAKGVPEEILLNACVAISVHNWVKRAARVSWDDKTKEDFSIQFFDNPLVALLVLCDQLQVWGRQTGLETVKEKPGIECAELRSIGREGTQMELVLNYLSFRYVSPEEIKAAEIIENVRNILDTKVVPVLDRVKIPSDKAKLSVRFLYDGRQEVRSVWRSFDL